MRSTDSCINKRNRTEIKHGGKWTERAPHECKRRTVCIGASEGSEEAQHSLRLWRQRENRIPATHKEASWTLRECFIMSGNQRAIGSSPSNRSSKENILKREITIFPAFAVINDSKRQKWRRVYQCQDGILASIIKSVTGGPGPRPEDPGPAGGSSGWSLKGGRKSCMEYQERRGRESTATSFHKVVTYR